MEDGMEEIQNIVFAAGKSLEGEEAEEAEQAKESGEAMASGLVKNLIANLVPGNGGEEGKPDEKSGELTEDGGRVENQKEGGTINHLISNLVSPRMSPTAAMEADERKGVAELKVKSEDHGTFKSEEEFEGGGGGGIINNLISNMFHHAQGERGEEGVLKKKIRQKLVVLESALWMS